MLLCSLCCRPSHTQVCDNCVDRWAEVAPERIAIIWEGDDPQHTQTITYKALLNRVCKFANMLKRLGEPTHRETLTQDIHVLVVGSFLCLSGVRRYDTVGIYMPMIPETIYAMLACARLGAIHSVVFAGFSAPNLRDRLIDAHCKIVCNPHTHTHTHAHTQRERERKDILVWCD